MRFVHHFRSFGQLKLHFDISETLNCGQNWRFVPRDIEIWQITLQNVGHLFYATLKFVHHCVPSDEIKLRLQVENVQLKMATFVSRDLEIWQMILENNTVPLKACHLKLCASFRNHQKFKRELRSEKAHIGAKNCFDICDHDLWPLTFTFGMASTSVNGYYSCKTSWWYKDRNIVKRER